MVWGFWHEEEGRAIGCRNSHQWKLRFLPCSPDHFILREARSFRTLLQMEYSLAFLHTVTPTCWAGWMSDTLQQVQSNMI
mmetsp:Transcript_836/g.2565  ORF Transcript_836/g.2565 Transcript_836/m.2565 type:complete len:80 (-) Transcript_836:1408-1647(-)